MTYEKIDLISEMLDATLNLKCFYIKHLDDNIEDLRDIIPPIFTINENDFNRFLNSISNTKDKHVYLIEDFIFGNYIIICLDEKQKNYLFVGPYLLTNNHDNLLKNLKEYNISDKDLELIKKYYMSMPFISKSKITSIISVIKNNIYGEDTNLHFRFKNNRKNSYLNKNNSSKLSFEYINHKFIEESDILEQKLLGSVKLGRKVNAVKFSDKIQDLYFIEENIYSLRNCKNKLIYYNTLLANTVKNNGISNTYTESLFQTYMDRIEGASSINDIKEIFHIMVIDYCFAVSEFNIKYFSDLVGKVIDYINANLQNNLSVNEIANLFFVSPTYLSRIFKKETGLSIVEYINKLKIKHSTFLLRDTLLPIQDISSIIGINDVNYFSRLFKKYMKQTPTQYRKNFK